jgi:hypothetical protein
MMYFPPIAEAPRANRAELSPGKRYVYAASWAVVLAVVDMANARHARRIAERDRRATSTDGDAAAQGSM